MMNRKAALTAQKLLSRFAIDDPTEVPIEDLILSQDAMYEEKPIKGAEGRILFSRRAAIVVVNKHINNLEKKRFVKAHELGHLMLHRDVQPYFQCDEAAFMEWHRSGSQEVEANEFAAELLMPQQLFRQEANSKPFSLHFVRHLAKLFQTSLTATAIRYTKFGGSPIGLFYSQNGVVKWFCRSDDFLARCRNSTNAVHPHSVASQFFKGQQLPNEPELVPPYAWFSDRYLKRDTYFMEVCFPIRSQNSVLSFLWVSGDF